MMGPSGPEVDDQQAWLKRFPRLASPQPNFQFGLRATLASLPPLLLAAVQHNEALGWMALGGFYVNLADGGGAYRTKATAMGLATILGAASLWLGILIAKLPWLCVAGMFLWALGCALMSLYGSSGAVIGLVVAWCFLIGINTPTPTSAAAAQAALLYLAGSVWGILIALAIWPLRPYQPVRTEISRCCRAILGFLQAACPEPPGTAVDEVRLYEERVKVRNALADSRTTLGDTRGGRIGDSPIDGALLTLIDTADRLYITAAALGELLGSSAIRHRPAEGEAVGNLVMECRNALTQLALAMEGKAPIPAVRDLQAQLGSLETLVSDDPGDELRAVVTTLRQWIDDYRIAVATLPSAFHTRPARDPGGGGDPAARIRALATTLQRGWLVLQSNLSLDSIVFRHGLRFAVTSAVAVAIYTVFQLPSGYWITLTVSVILRPSAGDSFHRGFQRLGGTVLGGSVAIVLAALLPHPLAMVLLMVPLTIVMMAFLQVNYGIFVFLLTPWIVLYKDVGHPGDWEVAFWRIANTVIGAGLALLASRVFLPRWESERLPAQLASTMRANTLYVETVFTSLLDPSPGEVCFAAINQRVRLAMNNTHASLQRFLQEGRRNRRRIEPLLAFLIYSQRLIDVLVTLQNHLRQPHPPPQQPPQLPGLRPLASTLDPVLTDLCASLELGDAPGPLPDLTLPPGGLRQDRGQEQRAAATADTLVLEREIGRLVDQVAGLHGAVCRLQQAEAHP